MAEDGFLLIIAEGHVPQLPVPEAEMPPVGGLAQKDPAQCGFAAGHRASDADDLPGPEGEGKTGKERGLSGIGKAEVLRLDGHRLSGRQLRQGLHRLHQGLDPPPGHLGLMNGVEQLGRLGGLVRQLGKAGQKGGELRDGPGCPPGAQHVSAAEIENEHGPPPWR